MNAENKYINVWTSEIDVLYSAEYYGDFDVQDKIDYDFRFIIKRSYDRHRKKECFNLEIEKYNIDSSDRIDSIKFKGNETIERCKELAESYLKEMKGELNEK